MSDWFHFDAPTVEEIERDRRLDSINNAEGKVKELIRQITTTADAHPDVATAASAALTHIATLAQVGGQTLFRRSLRRGR